MPEASPSPRSARLLSRGDLRLLVLALLAEQPRHGYELIQHVSELFARTYTPSAGTIYPLLTRFEQDGWIVAEDGTEGSRRRFRLTAAGLAVRQALAEEIDQAQRRAWHRAREVAKAAMPEALRMALHGFKQALVRHHGQWQPGEAERAAALLDAVTAELNRLPAAPLPPSS